MLLLSSFNLFGAYGTLLTLDGKKLEGEIQLKAEGLMVSVTNQAPTRVDLANVSVLRFRSTAATEASSTTNLAQAAPGTSVTNRDAGEIPPPVPIPEPTGRPATKPRLPAGILMTGGTMISCRISSGDDTSLRFLNSTNEMALSTVNVARIMFQPLPVELEEQIKGGRAGVLLSSKEFVEGDFKSFSQGQIKVSSVLFGTKTYDPGQVIAVILRPEKPTPARYELKTRDDSRFLVNNLRVQNESILLQDPAVAGLSVSSTELVELRRQ
jgi:hypothetical protein